MQKETVARVFSTLRPTLDEDRDALLCVPAGTARVRLEQGDIRTLQIQGGEDLVELDLRGVERIHHLVLEAGPRFAHLWLPCGVRNCRVELVLPARPEGLAVQGSMVLLRVAWPKAGAPEAARVDNIGE